MGKGAGGRSEPTDDDTPAPAPSWRNAWPFLAALAVVVIAVVLVLSSNLLRPATERAGDSGQVQQAISDYYDARNNVDYPAFADLTCARDRTAEDFPDAARFRADTERSLSAKGRIVIPEITDLTVTGDRARATVHWHFDKDPDDIATTQLVAVRENENWKVCKA
ncbi:MAG: hypothetical protein QM662_13615 [Gordonia sp. (in: high G+C Gram-positive bacteria)]